MARHQVAGDGQWKIFLNATTAVDRQRMMFDMAMRTPHHYAESNITKFESLKQKVISIAKRRSEVENDKGHTDPDCSISTSNIVLPYTTEERDADDNTISMFKTCLRQNGNVDVSAVYHDVDEIAYNLNNLVASISSSTNQQSILKLRGQIADLVQAVVMKEVIYTHNTVLENAQLGASVQLPRTMPTRRINSKKLVSSSLSSPYLQRPSFVFESNNVLQEVPLAQVLNMTLPIFSLEECRDSSYRTSNDKESKYNRQVSECDRESWLHRALVYERYYDKVISTPRDEQSSVHHNPHESCTCCFTNLVTIQPSFSQDIVDAITTTTKNPLDDIVSEFTSSTLARNIDPDQAQKIYISPCTHNQTPHEYAAQMMHSFSAICPCPWCYHHYATTQRPFYWTRQQESIQYKHDLNDTQSGIIHGDQLPEENTDEEQMIKINRLLDRLQSGGNEFCAHICSVARFLSSNDESNYKSARKTSNSTTILKSSSESTTVLNIRRKPNTKGEIRHDTIESVDRDKMLNRTLSPPHYMSVAVAQMIYHGLLHCFGSPSITKLLFMSIDCIVTDNHRIGDDEKKRKKFISDSISHLSGLVQRLKISFLPLIFKHLTRSPNSTDSSDEMSDEIQMYEGISMDIESMCNNTDNISVERNDASTNIRNISDIDEYGIGMLQSVYNNMTAKKLNDVGSRHYQKIQSMSTKSHVSVQNLCTVDLISAIASAAFPAFTRQQVTFQTYIFELKNIINTHQDRSLLDAHDFERQQIFLGRSSYDPSKIWQHIITLAMSMIDNWDEYKGNQKLHDGIPYHHISVTRYDQFSSRPRYWAEINENSKNVNEKYAHLCAEAWKLWREAYDESHLELPKTLIIPTVEQLADESSTDHFRRMPPKDDVYSKHLEKSHLAQKRLKRIMVLMSNTNIEHTVTFPMFDKKLVPGGRNAWAHYATPLAQIKAFESLLESYTVLFHDVESYSSMVGYFWPLPEDCWTRGGGYVVEWLIEQMWTWHWDNLLLKDLVYDTLSVFDSGNSSEMVRPYLDKHHFGDEACRGENSSTIISFNQNTRMMNDFDVAYERIQQYSRLLRQWSKLQEIASKHCESEDISHIKVSFISGIQQEGWNNNPNVQKRGGVWRMHHQWMTLFKKAYRKRLSMDVLTLNDR